jgi:hypothetical protein
MPGQTVVVAPVKANGTIFAGGTLQTLFRAPNVPLRADKICGQQQFARLYNLQ